MKTAERIDSTLKSRGMGCRQLARWIALLAEETLEQAAAARKAADYHLRL